MQPGPKALPWILAAEVVLALVVLFGDIGFDHPGRFGLDFGHALLILALFLILWSLGLWKAARARSWALLGAQLVLPIAAALALALQGRPAAIPRLRAEDYQHLVGRDEPEVQAELGDVPGATLFTLEHDGAVDRRELQLAGMTVRYSPEGRVVAVEANGR